MIYSDKFLKFLSFLAKLEGGVSNDPNDHGGLTKLGVTQTTFNNYLKTLGQQPRSVTTMTVEEMRAIYYLLYYSCVKPRTNELSYYLLFDLCVNSGQGALIRAQQEIPDLENPDLIIIWREARYEKIVRVNPTQSKFLAGWKDRLKRIQNEFPSFNPS